MDPIATINWADFVDSDQEDFSPSSLDSGLEGSDVLQAWIKSVSEDGIYQLALTDAPKLSTDNPLQSEVLVNDKSNLTTESSRSTLTSTNWEGNQNSDNHQSDAVKGKVLVPATINSSSTSRLPKTRIHQTRVLYSTKMQNKKSNVSEASVRQQQPVRDRETRRTPDQNHELEKLQRLLNEIVADQNEINEALRALKMDNPSAHHGSHPCPSSLVDRVEFDRCTQVLDESFEDFYIRLCKVASKAQLCSCCSDQRMATRIALGLRNRAFSKELMEITPFPTLENIVKICRANDAIDHLMNRTPCPGCGQMKHRNKVCQAIGAGCIRCKSKDHYQLMCPLKSTSRQSRDLGDKLVVVKKSSRSRKRRNNNKK